MLKVIEAIKKIYPEINGGFVYWETKQDGFPWDHPQDGLIWENANFIKPTWDQITSKFDIIELEQQKIIKINICLNYLKNTDWYVIRSLDPSNLNPIPENILKNRADARLLQDVINNINSLIELNNLNINFID